MSEYPQGELHQLVTADGNTFVFPDGDMFVLSFGGYGAPQTNYQTRRGYRQHGVTEIDYFLQPRTVALSMYRAAAKSRQDYWDRRNELLNIIRPNRGGPIVMTLRQPDGALRSLTVRASPGFQFDTGDGNAWDIDDDIMFIAHDPTWFDSAVVTSTPDVTTDDNLVFPITFPIVFGTAGLLFETTEFTYEGTWRTYPTITINGPYLFARLRQVTTGIEFSLNVAISAGEQRIIDLTPGDITIINELGDNKFSDLGPASNLVEFAVWPDPEVTDGINQLRAELQGGSAGTSSVIYTYNNRYFGV